MQSCFTDRELSWIEFNRRVLLEADNPSVPLLERLKFLNIFYSNLDEFLMVRVGSLTHRNILMPDYKDPKTGWNTQTQLKKILKATDAIQKDAGAIYEKLKKELAVNGIEIVNFAKISKLDESIAKKLFAEVKDYLSVRVVDTDKPMQFLGNKDLYVANHLAKGDKHYLGITSLYRVPPFRVFDNDGTKKVFIMSELVGHFAKGLYKKYSVKESCVIKVVRNADVFISEDSSEYSNDFKEEMKKLLKKRKRQQPVYMMADGNPSKPFRQLICKSVGIEASRFFINPTPLNVGFGSELGSLPQYKYVPHKSVRGTTVQRGKLISYLDNNDMLLSFPYQRMDAFVDLLYEAADNPSVLSIKITLYRLSYSSKVAMALAYAADKGKDVLCLLELRARFDEKNNIDYSEMLTQAGCKVIYGLPDMKVHAKLCLITRKTGRSLSYITQIGTGNYNEKTSEQYCDLSYITSDKNIAHDAQIVFSALENGAAASRTEHLMTAPFGYKQRLIELMEEECQKGKRGQVSIKVNSINDMDVMQEIIKCSCAGVKVELFVRGICCIVPGIPGKTENVSVTSVIGRYLEHSRIIVIGKGQKRRIFMGSGDLLNRNTNRRVEVLAEIKSAEARKNILYVMDAFRNDKFNAWAMQPDCSYKKIDKQPNTSSQEKLYKYFTKAAAAGKKNKA